MAVTVSVAVDVRHPNAKKEYTYLVPETLAPSISIGDLVYVPFNNIKVSGVVTHSFNYIDKTANYELKEVISKKAISLPKDLVKLARTLSKYYGAPIIDFLKLMLPPKVSVKKELVFFACSDDVKISGRAFNQKRIFEFLKDNSNVTARYIADNLRMPVSSVRSALAALIKKEIICRNYQAIRRKPILISNVKQNKQIELTNEQQKALEEITKNYYNKKNTTLIYGVTGSGKTEVYIRVIEKVLLAGEKAIVLVPEISLTLQMLSAFRSRFPGKTAILHSKLSQGERFDEWNRINSGEASVILGARSAIFAPVKNLGVIIIDEEHETSYKNGEHPYYDARTIAKFRAKKSNAMLVLGSATPSVESFYKAATKEYLLVKLVRRVSGRLLPKMEIINMKKELKTGNRHIFSRKLLAGIKKALEQKKQVILFLNRRGYSTFVICRDCGFVLKCKYCDISLTYHFEDKSAKCHYCGYSVKAPDICPECKSKNIRYFGAGTEKVEQEIKRFFPGYTTLRIDSDTTSKKGSTEKLLQNFKKGASQILVGTQVVAKGLDFPNVSLVGVISADTVLNFPDFRSGERTFQLITQVAGRAGRGDTPGIVYVQTYAPEAFAIKAACGFDITSFYQEELRARRKAFYPPFCYMLNIMFKGCNEKLVKKEAEKTRKLLGKNFSNNTVIYGPVPAPKSKIKQNYRYNILLKSKQTQTLVNVCEYMQVLNISRQVYIAWDMEPQDLM